MFEGPPAGCESVLRPAWNPEDPSRLAVVCVDGAGTYRLRIIGIDGDRIAFKSDRAGPSAREGNHVWVVSADGTDPRQLPAGDEGGGRLSSGVGSPLTVAG